MNKSLTRNTISIWLAVVFLGLSACSGDTENAPAVAESPVVAAEPEGSAELESQTEVSAGGVDKDIIAIYQRSCISCHMSGAAGAPKSHDAAAWAPILAKGMDALITSIKEGLNAMPPKGMCFDCSDEQYRALVDYMAGPQPD
ncbi:MAG: c-type cytochrome [Pseudomonadota bacterium]